ncbi:hypothetical protein SCUCBS95973_000166 [Sporothrix curviconia]|uniref:Nicotinamide N-methyltransferase n=1 Tax=Sporothrix curviconia TaxID=1260050 RepID=A0ABP0AN13_9PEZI
MSLVARVTLTGAPGTDPEDYLSSALGFIFPDDTASQHGDADHGVLYTSPNLPEPLHLSVTDPSNSTDRQLFSHFVWNSSLLLAKLVEAGTLEAAERSLGSFDSIDSSSIPAVSLRGSGPPTAIPEDPVVSAYWPITDFDVAGKSCIEFGAGAALPSILAALLGATRVAITDYPSDVVLNNLRENLTWNVKAPCAVEEDKMMTATAAATTAAVAALKNPTSTAAVSVHGHKWGTFDSDFARAGHHAYDRVFACDCLWMPWEHDNLRKSIDWFMNDNGDNNARCWVIGGFHTGRSKVAAFFDEAALAACDLEIEAIWERDCDDYERAWTVDRGVEDIAERKRWQAVAILRRRRQ